jgi:hypothetical protein
MKNKYQETKRAVHAELETTRKAFHALLASMSESDLRKRSRNPGWTNGEILAHMTFGFIILNALLPLARLWGHLPKWTSKIFAWILNAFTVPFNWVNALGARLQALVFTHKRIGRIYDWAYASLINQIEGIKAEEWERRMYYPTRWDSNFNDFMTVRELFYYTIRHFNFHLGQITQ